ncbi:STAS/SEC14 domain-containing protein [candidate division WOR-3 bacterium]|nr:STAS/SEC14 domain-containing protein [candidate division WOR-3 bacterium]
MKHRINFDEGHGVLNIHFVGEITPEEYIALNEKYKSWPGEKPKRILIDLSETDLSTWVPWDRETRKRVNRSIEPFSKDTKVAVLGVTAISKMVMKIAFNVLGVIKTSKFFNTKQEAIFWLKE